MQYRCKYSVLATHRNVHRNNFRQTQRDQTRRSASLPVYDIAKRNPDLDTKPHHGKPLGPFQAGTLGSKAQSGGDVNGRFSVVTPSASRFSGNTRSTQEYWKSDSDTLQTYYRSNADTFAEALRMVAENPHIAGQLLRREKDHDAKSIFLTPPEHLA